MNTTKKISTNERLELLQEKYGRKDLSFGCGVIINGTPGIDRIVIRLDTEKQIKTLFFSRIDESRITKILGHDLNLAEVSKALIKKYGWERVELLPEPRNRILVKIRSPKVPLTKFFLNLSKNLLRDQSEEVKIAICDLLNPSK